MAISKPSWLRRWLDRLNWDIFVWHIYVGDAIEGAIDWVLDKVNLALDLASVAYDRALSAWSKAVELAGDLRSLVYREVQDILDELSTWSDQLNEWWATKRSWLHDLIDAAVYELKSYTNSILLVVNKLEAAWDSFRTETLPGLFTIDRWTAFWGGKIDNISDWWAARRQQVSDMIDVAVEPVRSEVNKYIDTLDKVKQFLTDPLSWKDRFAEWVLSMLENILARLWSK